MNTKAQQILGTSNRKPLYIALIVIALVVVLILIYFGTKTSAGQATGTGTSTSGTTNLNVGQAGIISVQSPTALQPNVVVTIGANIGAAQTVAFDFALNYPVDALQYVTITPTNWGADAFSRSTPPSPSGSFLFEYGTIDHTLALSGNVVLATVEFWPTKTVTSADLQRFSFSGFHVYNLADDSNLIDSTVTSAGTVAEQCVVSTQDECLNIYNNLILASNFPAGTTVDDAACTAYYNAAAHSSEKDTLCAYNTECPSRGFTLGGAGYNADLTLDGQYNANDALIVYGTAHAKDDINCGGWDVGENNPDQIPCLVADGVYVCDNGAFRMRGLDIYNNGNPYTYSESARCSQFTMVR